MKAESVCNDHINTLIPSSTHKIAYKYTFARRNAGFEDTNVSEIQ